MMRTTTKKLVPQRGCQVTKRWAFSTFTGCPDSKIEYHFVLGPVVFENAPHVPGARQQNHEAEEDADAENAVDHVDGETSADGMEVLAELGGEIQRQKIYRGRS